MTIFAAERKLCKLITNLRKQCGLSADALARKSGLCPKQVKEVCSRKAGSFAVDLLAKMMMVLDQGRKFIAQVEECLTAIHGKPCKIPAFAS